ADDGGGQVSVNGGTTWTEYYNQPTAEFYSVTVDNGFPYRVYGPQQDNSTITVPAWTGGGISPEQYWYSVGGCETGPISFDPDDPSTIWSGCYGGVIDRWNAETDEVRNMMVYPQMQLGVPAEDLKYRFQWNSPILVSPHDPDVVYHASNVVHRTTDRGMSWEEISPDLTTDTPEHHRCGGVPITCEGTGVEVFNTVYSLVESPRTRGELWAGTDDGRVWIRRGPDAEWTEITPDDLPDLGTVNRIELSPHRPGKAYLAVHRYRLDDFRPYVFRTTDYGGSWTLLTSGRNGIPANHPTRSVREDPDREGLLYVGTEFGLFVSFDDGRNWQSLQLDLPVSPVTDLAVHRNDLVVATQGRSFWILDDLSPLHQLDAQVAQAQRHLFAPSPAYRVEGGFGRGEGWPENRPPGATIYYRFAQDQGGPVELEILDEGGEVLRAYSSEEAEEARGFGGGGPELSAEAGMHRFRWDLRTESVEIPEDATSTSWGFTGGVKVVPGTYTVRLTSGEWSQERPIEVRKDPRLEEVTQADLVAQWEMANEVKDSLQSIYDELDRLRSVRDQVTSVAARIEEASDDGDPSEIAARADSIARRLTEIEERIINTDSEARQDPINFQPRLDHQVAYLYGFVAEPDGRPTEGSRLRFQDLNGEWAEVRSDLLEVLRTDVEEFNRSLRQRDVAPVIAEGGGAP
ncbi:MAG TPA: hypothetical protein VLL48_04980, partial [Longimicrobiales bacterium]|nr:hypothetical protein [Longimicrobiales bacterium]